MRLFATQIVYGFSSEAKVFAGLLGKRPRDIEPTVLMHRSIGDDDATDRFSTMAACDVLPFDTGWRVNSLGRRLSVRRYLVALNFQINLSKVANIASKVEPDVIYSCQQHYDCSAATYVAKKLNKPQIIHLHYVIGPWLKKSVLDRLLTCDHVITVSDFIRSEAIKHGVPPERVTTVRNSINPMAVVLRSDANAIRAELGLPLDSFVFGFVGRIDPGKSHADTISAFENAIESMPNARLVIVGEGSIQNEIIGLAAASKAADKILFTGKRRDVPLLLGAMDAFVHPSRYDPCPLAVLEAMASGLPVIGYDEGGIKEMLVSGQSGFLPASGDISGLSSAMIALYQDRDLAKSIGQRARARIAESFRPEAASLKFAEVLRSLS